MDEWRGSTATSHSWSSTSVRPASGQHGPKGGQKETGKHRSDGADGAGWSEMAPRMDWPWTGRAQPESPNNSTVAFIRANQKPHGTSQLPSTRVPGVMLAAGTPPVRSKGAGTPNARVVPGELWRCWQSHKTITPPSSLLPSPRSSPLRILPIPLSQTNRPFLHA